MLLVNTSQDGVTFFNSLDEIPTDTKAQKLAMSVVMGYTNDKPEGADDEDSDVTGDDVTRFQMNKEKELARENLLQDIASCNGCNAVIIESAQFETINSSATAFIIRATLLNVRPA